jgi:acetolactate synthase I/III small subunit
LTHQLFTITGTRGPQLLPQLFGLIVHRQTVLLSCHACRLGDEMQVQLLVDLPDDAGAELLHRRLDRIVDVVKTVHSPAPASHQLRAVLVRVDCDAHTRGQVTDIARAFRAEILEIGPFSMTLSFSGAPSRVTELLGVLDQFGVRELVDSGTIALRRGAQSPGVRTLRRAACM